MQPAYQSPVEVAPGIYQLPVPIPIPLKYVNCYILKGPSGWTLVDAGFHDALAEAAWPRALGELGIRWQDVDRILVTHYHPDHLGGAGWLQELTGAPVFMHDMEVRQVELFWGGGMAEQAEALRAFFAGHGMPAEMAAAIARHHHHQSGNVTPLPQLTGVAAGEQLRLGAADYAVIWAPGHSDGLAIFFDANSGLLLANDMILDKITPNVSLWPDCRPNPLEDYLRSLQMVGGLGARLALPGHRNIIGDVAGRAAAIRQHHAERLAKMRAAVAQRPGGATAWEVCEEIFTPGTLTVHQIRFAMSETLAHLVYMEGQGELHQIGDRFMTV